MLKNEELLLQSPFNLERHKKIFNNQLKVVILENGKIEYAYPSHRLKITEVIAKKHNITQKQVAALCPPLYRSEYFYWLCVEANAIMVWNKYYIGDLNAAQLDTLTILKKSGLYKGNIELINFKKN